MILPETKTLAHLFEDCTSKYHDLTVNTMVGWTSGQTYQELKEKLIRKGYTFYSGNITI